VRIFVDAAARRGLSGCRPVCMHPFGSTGSGTPPIFEREPRPRERDAL